tara:strand:+ start:12 stop:1109 length:1098 start_codon:yes stop_codon:yes gene_type:complete
MLNKKDNYRYEIFDCLRGLAIFLVFINHIPYNDYLLNDNTPILVKKFFLSGTYGVQLFYIVSAATLLLSLNLRNEKNFKHFYIRRFFRIVPIFYIGIVIHFLYYNIYSSYNLDLLNFKNIFLNILFLNNIIPPSNDLILGGSTIATEMNFYLILPIIFLIVNTYKKSLVFSFASLILIVIANILSKNIFPGINFGEINFYRTIFCQIYIFSLGICFFEIHKDSLLNFLELNIKSIIYKILPFIILIILMIIFEKQEPEYFYFKNMFLVSTIFFVLINIFFIITKFISKNIFFKFFVNLGKISFSMYILHWITIHFSWELFKHLDYFRFYLIFFILVSFLLTYICSYYFSRLEYFFIKIGKKYLNR